MAMAIPADRFWLAGWHDGGGANLDTASEAELALIHHTLS
jgi:hypothetical protein